MINDIWDRIVLNWAHTITTLDWENKLLIFAYIIRLILEFRNVWRRVPPPLQNHVPLGRSLVELSVICAALVGSSANAWPPHAAVGANSGEPLKIQNSSWCIYNPASRMPYSMAETRPLPELHLSLIDHYKQESLEGNKVGCSQAAVLQKHFFFKAS